MMLPSLTEERPTNNLVGGEDEDEEEDADDDDLRRGAKAAPCSNNHTSTSSRNSIIEPAPPASYASKSGFIAIQANNSVVSRCSNDTDSAADHHQMMQLVATDGNSSENAGL